MHKRAFESVRIGIDIRHSGYNLPVLSDVSIESTSKVISDRESQRLQSMVWRLITTITDVYEAETHLDSIRQAVANIDRCPEIEFSADVFPISSSYRSVRGINKQRDIKFPDIDGFTNAWADHIGALLIDHCRHAVPQSPKIRWL